MMSHPHLKGGSMPEDWLPQLINGVSGPASGVVIAVSCLGGFGWFLVKHLLPSHERQIDKMLVSHGEDRVLFKQSLTELTGEMKSISSKVETIDRKIDAIEDDVKDLRHKTAV
jgi:hypothetical protein